MGRKNFSYDEYSDSLIVSNRNEEDSVEDNFEFGDIVFSLARNGKILGVEIRGVSNFLESCDINSDILKNLRNAKLKVIPKRGIIFLVLKIEIADDSSIIYYDIPLILPLINRGEHLDRSELISA